MVAKGSLGVPRRAVSGLTESNPGTTKVVGDCGRDDGEIVGIAVVLACALRRGGRRADCCARGERPRARSSQQLARRRASRGRANGGRARVLARPGGVIDRTLDAVVALPGVDAALDRRSARTATATDARTRAAGLSDDEIERTLSRCPPIRTCGRSRSSTATGSTTSSESSKLPALGADRVAPRRRRDDRLARRHLPLATRGFPETRRTRSRASPAAPGPAIWNAIRFVEAREHAELDSLTGLHNRRLFYEFLGREIARARRYERYVSLIVFDLDDFKRINDRIGHLGGDAVLAEVADRVAQRRPRDRHPVPGRRRRVRRDPPRGRAATTPSCSPTASRSRSARRRSRRSAR